MSNTTILSIEPHFWTFSDPSKQIVAHQMGSLDVFVIAACPVIFGTDNGMAVETFGQTKKIRILSFLELPKNIRLHDTFGRVRLVRETCSYNLANNTKAPSVF